MSARYIVGDVFDALATLPDNSVDLVFTSPPFLALRSYLPADHPDKAKEIGSEATPGEFLDRLLDVVVELRRVLAPHGTLCVELGDTYSGSGGAGGDYGTGGLRDGQSKFSGSALADRKNKVLRPDGNRLQQGPGWPLDKSLCCIPALFEASLAYGRNLLTGREIEPWRVRNWHPWCRPNPPVGCVDDATEALTPDGWKRHGELSDGDLIAAYDPRSDSCRFLPATFVRWEREGEPMVTVDKRATSQVLTEDHRCWVRTRKAAPHVRLARDLTNECQTLLCAPFDDVPGAAPVTTERAALLGWYIAEGSIHHRQARIRQSPRANPEKVAEIRRLLDVDGADYTETIYDRGPGTGAGTGPLTTFTVKGSLGEWLNLHHKRLPMAYATTWPEAQARALFDALIDGDGHRRAHRGLLFHQKDEAVADGVQVLALRLGYRASKSYQPPLGAWQITMSMAPVQDRRWTKLRKWAGEGLPRGHYTGIVWCPQIETTFWLARRSGKTFITGNSLGDKWRPATSFVVSACTSGKRFFDLDAVRGPHSEPGRSYDQGDKREAMQPHRAGQTIEQNPNGAPPLDWLLIPTEPYPGSHYATFPRALVVPFVKSACPQRVCRTCGEPSRRIVKVERITDGNFSRPHAVARSAVTGAGPFASNGDTSRETLGWSDCGHDDWRPGLVLDPFAGSGTVLAVASGHGLDTIGVDLDARNAELALERVGPMLLTIETTNNEGATP